MVNHRNTKTQKHKNIKLLLVFFIFIVNTATVNCQTIESINKKINNIKKDITLAEKLLKETSKNKEVSVNQVALLQTQISQRDELIKTYQDQVKAIEIDIENNKAQISILKKNLKLYQQEYSNLLLINYRNKGKANNLLFIISAEDFNQAYRRMRYIKELNGLITEKIEEIDSTQIKIQLQLDKNEKNKKDKENILSKEKLEKILLMKERDQLNNDIASLKKKEKQIQKDITAKQKQTKELKKQIEAIVAEETRKAKEREAAARKNNTRSVDYRLSSSFEQNKGKLPYPVENGIITRRYGSSQHPTQKNVTLENDGVDISTTKGSKAKCVFSGEVCCIMNQGGNNAILVRHGLYFTFYSNLEKVYVKDKEKVSTGQDIGLIHTNVNDGKTILHFEIWQNTTSLNPSLWIKKY